MGQKNWTYYHSGQKHCKYVKKKGKLHGTCLELGKEGDTIAIVNFKHGMLNGDFWFSEKAKDLNPNVYLDSFKLDFYIPYQSSASGTFIENKLTGTFTTWYSKGDTCATMQYSDGIAEGIAKQYTDQGELVYKKTIKNDKFDGDWFRYLQNGNLIEYRLYKMDTIKSVIRYEYHENNLLKSQTAFKYKYADAGKGVRSGDKINHGKWEQFYENGKLRSVGYYTEGKPDKEWKGYDENGKLTYIMKYENGEYKSYEKFD